MSGGRFFNSLGYGQGTPNTQPNSLNNNNNNGNFGSGTPGMMGNNSMQSAQQIPGNPMNPVSSMNPMNPMANGNPMNNGMTGANQGFLGAQQNPMNSKPQTGFSGWLGMIGVSTLTLSAGLLRRKKK